MREKSPRHRAPRPVALAHSLLRLARWVALRAASDIALDVAVGSPVPDLPTLATRLLLGLLLSPTTREKPLGRHAIGSAPTLLASVALYWRDRRRRRK